MLSPFFADKLCVQFTLNFVYEKTSLGNNCMYSFENRNHSKITSGLIGQNVCNNHYITVGQNVLYGKLFIGSVRQYMSVMQTVLDVEQDILLSVRTFEVQLKHGL